jgi:quinoprotein glucose dehydrogenase
MRTLSASLAIALVAVGLALAGAAARAADAAPAAIDETPLPVELAPAFPGLRWTGWEADRDGAPRVFRPILLTHPGDSSGRIVVAEQCGRVHVFRPGDTETGVFLDLRDKVHCDDRDVEEGFLGLAFHPRFRENGECFVHYTAADAPHTMVVERYRVSADDPDRADPASAGEILRIPHPAGNHKAGTICFGPDGFLYVACGDGGNQQDPRGNGQNLQSPLGKILRIDVDRREGDRAYAIPPDNPFVEVLRANESRPTCPRGVRAEIWAYGLRNVWRMSFDRLTGRLWIADVGEDRWEEINLGRKGANYGWNLREGREPYSPVSTATGPGFDDPVWQYDHDAGRSITGGHVYRGTALPQLAGHYLYADYVSGRVWGLLWDDVAGRVTANRPIERAGGEGLPVISFGEDQAGEVYACVLAADGRGILAFTPRRQPSDSSRATASASSPAGSAASTASSPNQPR